MQLLASNMRFFKMDPLDEEQIFYLQGPSGRIPGVELCGGSGFSRGYMIFSDA